MANGVWRVFLPVLFVGMLFAATAYIGIALTRESSRIALLWLPNAIAAGWLLRNNARNWLAFIVACLIGNIIVNRYVGDTWPTSVVLSLANAIEVSLVVWLMRRACGPMPDMAKISHNAWLPVAALAASAVSATIAAFWLSTDGNFFSVATWQRWLLADGLSLLIALPIILIAIDTYRTKQRPTRQELIDWCLMAAIVTAGTVAVFAQSRFPFLFLVSPLVLYAAFRTGVAGTAAAILIVTIVATIATALGNGPITLVKGGPDATLVAFQVFLASNFAIGLPVAAMLSERARDREELRVSRDRTKEILDNVQDIIFRTDREGNWISLNPAWEKLTGYTVEESLGWPTTRLLHPDDFAEAKEFYPRIVAGEMEEVDLIQRFYSRAGDIRTIEVRIRRLADTDGGFAGTIGNIRDVTDKKAQERALAASEARFRMIGETAPIGIFLADPNGMLTYINPWWAEKVGRTVDEMLGRGWLSSVADLEELLSDPPFTGFEPGMVRRREICFRAADGSDLWMETYNAAEFDEQGQLAGFAGAGVDITAQRELTRTIAKRDRELTELADNVTDAIVRMQLDRTCVYASPSSEQIFQRPLADLVGTDLTEGVHREDLPLILATFESLASGEKDRALVAFRPATDGDRWFEASCAAIRDPDTANPVQIIASIRDVSHTKALEADLRAARQAAEAAARAKSAFLANMSHEIRTPMNGVIGFTDLLERSDLDREQRRYVELIADSGRTMMQLLNDILDRSKIEAGQMQVTREPLNLRDQLRSVVTLMEPLARRKDIELESFVDPAMPQQSAGDKLRLKQVLQNLIGNAVKFTETGSVSVRVFPAGCGERFTLEVRDTGIGIAPENLERIFGSFTQADNTIARQFGGSGLGLAITRQLVELMEGTLDVESEIGIGSTFTVTLPLVTLDEAHSAPAAQAPGEASGGSCEGMRLLVAEDNDINQQLIAAMISSAGGVADIVDNGEDAIRRIEEGFASGSPYDLVLMDLQMPGLDGLAATRRLRASGIGPDRLAIVALTANAYNEDVEASKKAGMQGHIAKPLTFAALRSALNRFAKPASAEPFGDQTSALPVPDRLREKYVERKRELGEFAIALDDSNIAARWQELASRLHQLAGTAAVFGEPELGIFAAQREKELIGADSDKARLQLVTDIQFHLEKAA